MLLAAGGLAVSYVISPLSALRDSLTAQGRKDGDHVYGYVDGWNSFCKQVLNPRQCLNYNIGNQVLESARDKLKQCENLTENHLLLKSSLSLVVAFVLCLAILHCVKPRNSESRDPSYTRLNHAG